MNSGMMGEVLKQDNSHSVYCNVSFSCFVIIYFAFIFPICMYLIIVKCSLGNSVIV